MINSVVKGDLIEKALNKEFDVIIHGANCMHLMGAGIAQQIRKTWPQAYEADLDTIKGDKHKLGHYSLCKIPDLGLIIVNGYTQYSPGANIDYQAVSKLFDSLNRLQGLWYKNIGIPKIGAGIAGGDWNTIENLINQASTNLNITLVEYK